MYEGFFGGCRHYRSNGMKRIRVRGALSGVHFACWFHTTLFQSGRTHSPPTPSKNMSMLGSVLLGGHMLIQNLKEFGSTAHTSMKQTELLVLFPWLLIRVNHIDENGYSCHEYFLKDLTAANSSYK